MPERTISDQTFDAFVDQELGQDERLRVLRRIALDQRLGQEVCDREQIKVLLKLAYPEGSERGGAEERGARSATPPACRTGLMPRVPLIGRLVGAFQQVALGFSALRSEQLKPGPKKGRSE